MKMLIVEDEFMCRHLLQVYLADYGQSFVAVNGAEAVAAVTQALDEKAPYDLICLDIMMPVMNGWEALKQIRVIEQQRGIGGLDGVKIIITTALGQPDDILKSFKEGCEAYIIKPVRKPDLLAQMKKLGLPPRP